MSPRGSLVLLFAALRCATVAIATIGHCTDGGGRALGAAHTTTTVGAVDRAAGGMLGLLEPLSAIAIAWIAWGETPGLLVAIGAVVVLGATIISIRAAGQAHAPQQTG